jgi:hypothetical protein
MMMKSILLMAMVMMMMAATATNNGNPRDDIDVISNPYADTKTAFGDVPRDIQNHIHNLAHFDHAVDCVRDDLQKVLKEAQSVYAKIVRSAMPVIAADNNLIRNLKITAAKNALISAAHVIQDRALKLLDFGMGIKPPSLLDPTAYVPSRVRDTYRVLRVTDKLYHTKTPRGMHHNLIKKMYRRAEASLNNHVAAYAALEERARRKYDKATAMLHESTKTLPPRDPRHVRRTKAIRSGRALHKMDVDLYHSAVVRLTDRRDQVVMHRRMLHQSQTRPEDVAALLDTIVGDDMRLFHDDIEEIRNVDRFLHHQNLGAPQVD